MDLQAILVATDFSDCSGAALQMAIKLSERFGAKIILLHVINQTIVERLAEHLKVPADSLLPEFRKRAQEHLSHFLKRWGTGSLKLESMVAVGVPFQEIAVIARDLQVDLVTLGGYGRSGRGPIEEVFFGSTAEKVVRLLPCPVLCVPLAVSREP
jgi:nucleotide-binding universal stress UspA family protein